MSFSELFRFVGYCYITVSGQIRFIQSPHHYFHPTSSSKHATFAAPQRQEVEKIFRSWFIKKRQELEI